MSRTMVSRWYVFVPVVVLCALVACLAFGGAQALAAAPEAPVTLAASQVAGTSATLNGELNPGAVGEAGQYEFLYRASESECAPENNAAPQPPGLALGLEKEAVSASITGLTPGTKYTFCLLARNPAEETAIGPAVSFMTSPVPPTIVSEYVSQVFSTGATLGAQIDPGGGETTYHFDYGTTTGYGQSTTESSSIGADNGNHAASVPIQGLQPGTVYHYRVVATNSQSPPGGTLGPDHTLTTPIAGGQLPGSPGGCANEQLRVEQPYGLALPDCRAYEMVSPLEKGDNDAISGCFGSEFSNRASASGDGIAFNSPGSFAEPVGTRLCSAYVSSRGLGGWSTRSITPLHTGLRGAQGGGLNGSAFNDMYFTPDLSKGLVVEQTNPLTSDTPVSSAEVVYESIYLADLASSSYQLLESVGTEPGEPADHRVVGASSDLSHVLLEGLSEWVDGTIIPVGVNNKGESLGSAGAGSGAFSGQAEVNNRGDTWHAMSSDGKRVFMTSYGEEHGRANRDLYVRVNPEQPQSPLDEQGKCTVAADACTIMISASRRKEADPHAPYPARFWGASADGSKVFFTTKVELTEDAYTGPEDNRPNLYEYDVESGVLADLTVDTSDAEGATVLGVVAISEDGSYVYFVAKGNLATGATAGQPNLYVSHDGGTPKFIASLANAQHAENLEKSGDNESIRRQLEEAFFSSSFEGDNGEWNFSPQNNNAGKRAAVSPDGTELAFISERSLTGYDNEIVENSPVKEGVFLCKDFGGGGGVGKKGEKCSEVYLYNASTGSLVCASCNPTGERPLGRSYLSSVFNGQAAQVAPHNFSADGRQLFFQSYDTLTPHDSNGRLDVYEYEDGHVYPISNVTGGSDSEFLDASPGGENVFIATANQLLAQDTDLRVDIYDAKIGGGFPVTGASPACDNGDSCKPPPTAQPGVFGPPASATFSGARNLAPVTVKPVVKVKVKTKGCKKGFVKKRGRCVRKKAKKSGNLSKRGSK